MNARPLPPLPRTRALLPALAVAFVASLTAAPSAAFVQEEAVQAETAEVERAKAWPTPEDKGALADALNNLRKSKNDAQVTEWSDKLAAFGPSAAPRLLSAMTREKSEVARERMVAVLDRVTAPEHTRLIAEEFGSKSIDVRLFALRRVTELGDPGLREAAEKLWAASEKAAVKRDELAKHRNKKRRKEPDPKEVLEHTRTAILVFSCGGMASLDHTVALAGSKDWNEWREPLVAAALLAGAANGELAYTLAQRLVPKNPAPVRAGALRLLAYAGTEGETVQIAKMLDARENSVKIAAINALRRIVDGDEPLAKVSTFDAIELAKTWKQRVR